jgi:DNA-binding transcriptional MerR regulator
VSALGIPQPKSPDAFRTISEVAAELDVPQHVLRFWESRFSQIKPVKRAGGRRYYRPEDLDLLRGIQSLLYVDGLTIRGVQKILKERGPRHVAGIGRGKEPAPFSRAAEKKAEPKAEAKKPTHLRAVPPPMSLPFFDQPVSESQVQPVPGSEAAGLAAEERVKLKVLLTELEGLKKKLRRARRSAR